MDSYQGGRMRRSAVTKGRLFSRSTRIYRKKMNSLPVLMNSLRLLFGFHDVMNKILSTFVQRQSISVFPKSMKSKILSLLAAIMKHFAVNGQGTSTRLFGYQYLCSGWLIMNGMSAVPYGFTEKRTTSEIQRAAGKFFPYFLKELVKPAT